MKWLKGLFAKEEKSASIAKERLQLILSHEHAQAETPDYLPKLQQEIMGVIAKYVKVDREQVQVDFDKKGDCSILELNVTLPKAAMRAAAKKSQVKAEA